MKKLTSILSAFILIFYSPILKAEDNYKISGIDKWINSKPLQISELKDKVVLVDFWAYSCVVCLHSVPNLLELDKKYHDQGLVIIGVHTPEFGFEKSLSNVKKAIAQYHITYPIALDNKMQTWNNFNNHYWPAQYLFDKNGKLIYSHFGENEEDVLENNIRESLGLNKENFVKKIINKIALDKQTPEVYLGSERSNNNTNKNHGKFDFPEKLEENNWALQGNWKIEKEFIESRGNDSAIKLHFSAQKVFLVASSASKKPIKIEIFLDGKAVEPDNYGNDVIDGAVTIKDSKLYNLINLKNKNGGTLELRAKSSGLQAYAFTFRAK